MAPGDAVHPDGRPSGVRLRQVALACRDLEPVAGELRSTLGLDEPFHDPVVGEFGLANAVFAVGDTFIELVSPVAAGTAAGRHLERQGGDCGYMAIFQVPDLDESRRLVAAAGARVIWEKGYPDLVGRHLHPKDVPGSIMSLDWVDPPGSWRWAGPAWTARVPVHGPGGLTGLVVDVADPVGVAGRWGQVLGVEPSKADDGTPVLLFDGAAQRIAFRQAGAGEAEGITEVALAVPAGPGAGDHRIGGVRFVAVEAS